MQSGELQEYGARRWDEVVRAWEARSAEPRLALAVATEALETGVAGNLESRLGGSRRSVPGTLHVPARVRFVGRAARADALLNLEQWNEASAEVEQALAEVRALLGLQDGAAVVDLDPRDVPEDLSGFVTETLLVGLRSSSFSNDLAAALAFGRAALSMSDHFRLANLEARAHNDLASTYGRRDFHERAFHHLKAGVEVLERAGLPVIPQLLTNLGNVYVDGHRLDEALGCYQRGREGFDRAGDAFGSALARSNEGRLLVLTGDPEQGLRSLKEALDIFVALDRRAYVGTTLGKIGTAYAALGESLTAERWFAEALSALGDEELPFRGEVHEAYGSFLLERGRADEAYEEFVRAERYYSLAGSDGPAVGLIRYQARALEALGRYREAYERLARHIDLTEQLDSERGEAILGVMLVELEAGLADDHELPALTARVLSEANKSLRDQAEKLERISATDELTELHNRRYLNRRLRDEVLRAFRNGDDVSLILIDIDGFKAINDQFSHLVGDDVLRHMAKVLRGTFRRSDVVARWGGEEFAVLLPDTGKEAAAKVAEKARRAVADADWGSVVPGTSITVSAGVATASEAKLDGEGTGLLKLADRRLYAAKNSGRNRTTTE